MSCYLAFRLVSQAGKRFQGCVDGDDLFEAFFYLSTTIVASSSEVCSGHNHRYQGVACSQWFGAHGFNEFLYYLWVWVFVDLSIGFAFVGVPLQSAPY